MENVFDRAMEIKKLIENDDMVERVYSFEYREDADQAVVKLEFRMGNIKKVEKPEPLRSEEKTIRKGVICDKKVSK